MAAVVAEATGTSWPHNCFDTDGLRSTCMLFFSCSWSQPMLTTKKPKILMIGEIGIKRFPVFVLEPELTLKSAGHRMVTAFRRFRERCRPMRAISATFPRPAMDRRLQQSFSDSEVIGPAETSRRFVPYQLGFRAKVGTPGKCGAHDGALATKMLAVG